jgi:hypothetical protein
MKVNKVAINQLKYVIQHKLYKSFKSKEGYVFITNVKENKDLFTLLSKVGFFMFHKTNKRKQIVGLHQIVLFIYKGFKSLMFNGCIKKGQTEIHHIDHNPSNNCHHNLEYTTPSNNKAIATIVNICCDSNASYYNAQVQYDLDSVRLFYNVPFCELLVKSIKASSKLLNKDLFKQLLFALPFNQAKYIYTTCKNLMYN